MTQSLNDIMEFDHIIRRLKLKGSNAMRKQATITAVYHYGNERSVIDLSVSAFLSYMMKEITRGATLDTLAGRETAVIACISEVFTTGRSDSYGWTTYTLQQDG